MAGYVWEKGRALDTSTNGNIVITLAGTATDTTGMKQGKSFYIYNTGNATMYFGASSAGCVIPLATGSKDGLFISKDGHFYTKGTAGQTAMIQFVEDLG